MMDKAEKFNETEPRMIKSNFIKKDKSDKIPENFLNSDFNEKVVT